MSRSCRTADAVSSACPKGKTMAIKNRIFQDEHRQTFLFYSSKIENEEKAIKSKYRHCFMNSVKTGAWGLVWRVIS
jgi:hypothetical protein